MILREGADGFADRVGFSYSFCMFGGQDMRRETGQPTQTHRWGIMWLTALLCALFLGGCGAATDADTKETSAKTAGQTEAGDSETAEEETPAETSEAAGIQELSEEELARLGTFFQEDAHIGFLLSSYEDISNIKWDQVLLTGHELPSQKNEEILSYLSSFYGEDPGDDYAVITKKQLSDFMLEMTGSTCEGAKRPITQWTYYEDADSYGLWCYDRVAMEVTCLEGEQEGDLIRATFLIRYPDTPEENEEYETVVRETEDGYQVVSNRLCWEKEALSEQIFPVEINGVDGESFVAAYPQSGGDIRLQVICEDEIMDTLTLDLGETWQMKTLHAVDALDYNLDGYSDLAVIVSDGSEDHALIYTGYVDTDTTNVYRYFFIDGGVTAYLEEELASCTTQEIRMHLQDGNEAVFASYQEAYRYLAKILALENGDGCMYDLIYVDEDENPELVCGQPGYFVTLYTYADGKAYCVMSQMGYGVGGNYGYSYLPNENKIFNLNSDYAGAILYNTEMRIGKDHSLERVRTIREEYFADLNGNGAPDGEEEYSEENATYYEILSDGSEREITEEERMEIGIYDEDAAAFMEGILTYDELLGRL